jgi:hypothetical protein
MIEEADGKLVIFMNGENGGFDGKVFVKKGL